MAGLRCLKYHSSLICSSEGMKRVLVPKTSLPSFHWLLRDEFELELGVQFTSVFTSFLLVVNYQVNMTLTGTDNVNKGCEI